MNDQVRGILSLQPNSRNRSRPPACTSGRVLHSPIFNQHTCISICIDAHVSIPAQVSARLHLLQIRRPPPPSPTQAQLLLPPAAASPLRPLSSCRPVRSRLQDALCSEVKAKEKTKETEEETTDVEQRVLTCRRIRARLQAPTSLRSVLQSQSVAHLRESQATDDEKKKVLIVAVSTPSN